MIHLRNGSLTEKSNCNGLTQKAETDKANEKNMITIFHFQQCKAKVKIMRENSRKNISAQKNDTKNFKLDWESLQHA